VGPSGAVIYSNTSARQLFLGGRKLEGLDFDTVLQAAPDALRHAVRSGQDGLFTIEGDTGPETFHLSQKGFMLNARQHRLVLFKHLTRELSRREVETWKKVIRVIGHELNNSLAPVSSLAHSGGRLADAPDPERLKTIFATIEDRTRHLKEFIEGYARFARLPRPEPEAVDWKEFMTGISGVVRCRVAGALPEGPGSFDPAQLEQVMINLIKNAHESGSPPAEVTVSVTDQPSGQRIVVADRGAGMSDTVLASALLPFYSTKRTGTGLGLPLCREVAEAHGGRLSLGNRDGGGLEVILWLPPRTAVRAGPMG
jgi:nitrogen fixation/metabolism regulation signal transduction histidine kinase